MPQRTFPRLVAALVAVLLTLPASAAIAQTQRDLDRNRDKLSEARKGLETTENRRKATLADLQQIEARRAQIEGELSALNRTLAAAQSRLDAAQAKLDTITAELNAAELELDRTRVHLARERRKFNARVRETYKRGNTGFAVFAAMDVRDINEFTRGMEYVQRVMRADRDRIEQIASLERQVTARAEELDILRQRQRLLADAQASERDKVAALVADQRILRDRATAEEEKRRVALKDIESDKAAYAQLVTSLEQESANIEAELRRRAAEERKRREQEAAKPKPGAKPTEAPAASSGSLRRPYSGPQTSGFGWREHPIYGDRRYHAGVDYSGPTGDDFWAAGDGVVVSAGWRGGYGNTVVIDHGDGLATLYAHASTVLVKSGQKVKRGQPIARIGTTGASTGPHLHFEVRQDGEPQNPNRYV